MQLLDHVPISVAGLDRARPFYDAVMAALGAAKVYDHADALGYGGRDQGAPGLRPHYHPHDYAAFLSDPSGNRIEAVCHHAP